jgi:hypothetical protein
MSEDKKKDEAVESLKETLTKEMGKHGMRLATDDEVKELLEEGKEEREKKRAEMEKPEYDAKLTATREGWYGRARGVTLKTLHGFLAELAEFPHDYNTIVYATAAAALAAACALDKSPNGGITGFQAGAVFWEFFGEWMHERGKPARMVRYENMLFPQYEDHFQKTITPSTWKWLQEQAKKNLAESGHAAPGIRAHWENIVDGRVPFGYSVKDD